MKIINSLDDLVSIEPYKPVMQYQMQGLLVWFVRSLLSKQLFLIFKIVEDHLGKNGSVVTFLPLLLYEE